MIIVFGIVSPDFLTQANWLNTSVYATTTVLLALGETFVIITAGIDLSVGAILGVSSSVSALYLAGHHPFASNVAFSIAAVLGILSGIGMGALNGLIISYVGLSPFITTLGTLGIGTGITYLLTGGADVIVPASVGVYGNAVYFNWLPITVLVAIVLIIVCHFVLKYTRFGLRTYAVGSDITATTRSGINVKNHLLMVYMLSGFLAGIAGVLTMARFVVGSPTAGQNDELNAIAAVVIGGASLFGGRGDILGSIVGSVIVSAIVTGLVLMGVQPYWQTVTIGIVIILAVFIQQIAEHGIGGALARRLRLRGGLYRRSR